MPLRDRIRTLLEDPATPADPGEVARLVLAELDNAGDPATAYREALEEALPVYVRTDFSRRRLLPVERPEGPAAEDAPPVRRPSGHSPMVAACRDAWAARKAAPIKIGDVWKRLGECTAEDLLTAAAALRARAAATASKAAYYEALAGHLTPGATVADLAAEPVMGAVA